MRFEISNLKLPAVNRLKSQRAGRLVRHLSRTLYKSTLIMQNEPNFGKAQMNVNLYNKMVYEEKSDWTLGENEPKTNPKRTQSKPIAERVKMMQCVYLQRIMKKNADLGYDKTKPIQSQTKPILRLRSGQVFRLSLCL